MLVNCQNKKEKDRSSDTRSWRCIYTSASRLTRPRSNDPLINSTPPKRGLWMLHVDSDWAMYKVEEAGPRSATPSQSYHLPLTHLGNTVLHVARR